MLQCDVCGVVSKVNVSRNTL